jgi:hypothetical protein
MIRTFVAIAIAALAFPTLGHSQAAQPGTPDGENGGRYSFHRVEDGFLRLDLRTGYVSLCNRRTIGWACQTIPDERIALESEIARLQNDNGVLKKELLSRSLPLPGKMKNDVKTEPPAAKLNEPELKLPSQADMDRMKALVEKAWRRLVEVISQLQKEALQKI